MSLPWSRKSLHGDQLNVDNSKLSVDLEANCGIRAGAHLGIRSFINKTNPKEMLWSNHLDKNLQRLSMFLKYFMPDKKL